MAARMFSLSIPPDEVLHTLMGEVDGDVLHHEYYPLTEDSGFGFIVFERFYHRGNHHTVWVLHTENIQGVTHATLICTANSGEWDAPLGGQDEWECMDEMMGVLDEYIVDEKEI